ncbi:MAG: C45 family peptidase [Clostridiales bacterium]|nr:C45 family peptidase [Clostridiales bacterium]
MVQPFRKIVISGTPFERGVSYGTQARAEIEGSLKNYRRLFDESRTHINYDEAVVKAQGFLPAIEAMGPELVEEMRGIAQGAQIPFEEIVLLNCRSEVFALTPLARDRDASEECTDLTVLPEKTADGHLIVAQNWDMLHWAGDNALVVEILREDGPDMLCVTEAGMLCRYGLNRNGLALTVSSIPIGPLHEINGTPSIAIRRKFLSESHFAPGFGHIMEAVHMSGMHYNIGGGRVMGTALSIEAYPQGKYVMYAQDGVLAQANHSCYPGAMQANRNMGSTLYRAEILRRLMQAKEKVTAQDVMEALNNKAGAPYSVCAERTPGKPDFEQGCTLAGIVMDATDCRLWVRRGNDPAVPYTEYTWSR